MVTALSPKWYGLAALIWLLFGFGVMVLMHLLHLSERFSVGFAICVFAGWIGPSLFLAISGVGKGHPASRICAGLVLVAYIAFISMVIFLGFS